MMEIHVTFTPGELWALVQALGNTRPELGVDYVDELKAAHTKIEEAYAHVEIVGGG